MLDLYSNQYDRETLKNNIYCYKLMDIVKTQILDETFVVRYILNEKYQLHEEDKNITLDKVLFYQPHLHKNTITLLLLNYDSDEDSIPDFLEVSEK